MRSLALVPVREADPLGAIGVHRAKPFRPAEPTVARLRALATATGTALERILTWRGACW
ncbi:hypothetical protein GCM10010172_34150 [Paractinoplanes ferrugineus]|uniref:GAF domain-containing protein n=1 Tax=Paractinoplanes ferrugineus TaxID=113564 RepID=A0A919J6T1_9ACTN|nr:hypothetical protein [Actinoplanes ferrugineus]GIE14654.1 hypothetical protein Afe05nite_64940 [Actinoplanes ferrugineus]